MPEKDAEIQALSLYLINEIILAAGLRRTPRLQRTLHFFLQRVTSSLATICMTTDRKVPSEGFPAATGWMAGHWVRHVTTHGAEQIPAEGPVLVVSNHVGAYDVVVVPSQLNRGDIKIIASDTPFFRNLPNVSRHMIYASDDPGSRMAAARRGIRHLQEGGALLLFGTGLIDPDPAVFPDAGAAIGNWSGSIELFLRMAPQAQVVVCIVSGILKPRWAHSPLTRLRKVDWQKRRIAEYGQVIEQLLLRRKPDISPSMSIAAPVSVETLRSESGGEQVLPAVIARGKALLKEHCIRNKIVIQE